VLRWKCGLSGFFGPMVLLNILHIFLLPQLEHLVHVIFYKYSSLVLELELGILWLWVLGLERWKRKSFKTIIIYFHILNIVLLVWGCIELRFQRILKDFFIITKSCGIQSRLLQKLNKFCDIQWR
jgi:hypothetical protein